MTPTPSSSSAAARLRPSWQDQLQPTAPGADEFAELTEAVALLAESFTRSDPPPEVVAVLAARIREIAAVLADYEVSEDDQPVGKLWDRPGRGQILTPALHIDEVTAETVRARFTLGRFHSGRDALNGGVTPMIFDEALSRLANAGGRPWARTAHLAVDYLAPAPLHRELSVTAELVGEDGRKRWMRGEIRDDTTLLAEATGLWIVPRPPQPKAHS